MQSIVFDSVSKLFGRTSIPGWLRPGSRCAHTYALRNVSFSVPAGQVLVVLGPNGSGKTTTLKLLSTIFHPDSGSVAVNGRNTRTHAPLVRKEVAIALSNERSFYPRLTARENLNFFAALDDVGKNERKQRIAIMLRRTDLEHYSDVQVMKFSSGMYQRLALARALMKQPTIVLLDEPTKSLDPVATHRYWDLIRMLPTSGTVVVASHNFQEAVAVGDSVAILQHGELIAHEPIASMNAETLKSFYLDLTHGLTRDQELVEVAS